DGLALLRSKDFRLAGHGQARPQPDHADRRAEPAPVGTSAGEKIDGREFCVQARSSRPAIAINANFLVGTLNARYNRQPVALLCEQREAATAYNPERPARSPNCVACHGSRFCQSTRMEFNRDLELMRVDSRGGWIDEFASPECNAAQLGNLV